jgi:hypothetical protein
MLTNFSKFKKLMLGLSIFLALFVTMGSIRVQADAAVTTNEIAGTWFGNMHFSNRNSVERIKLSIPASCEPGSVCGTLENLAVQCTWEITYDGFSGGAYQYHFSDTLKGPCSAGSAGSLTHLPDGTLYRIHTNPMFTISGLLNQIPNSGQ